MRSSRSSASEWSQQGPRGYHRGRRPSDIRPVILAFIIFFNGFTPLPYSPTAFLPINQF